MRRSSTSEQPDPVFFTDRDLGPSVAAALRGGGLQVEAYHEHFKLDNVPDGEWLRFVGQKGWIALTHNKRIRYDRDELEDLMTYGVKAFFIIGKATPFEANVLRAQGALDQVHVGHFHALPRHLYAVSLEPVIDRAGGHVLS